MKQLLNKFLSQFKNRSNKKLAILILIALLISSAIAVGIYSYKNKEARVDCEALTISANELSKQKEYKKTYEILKSKEFDCAEVAINNQQNTSSDDIIIRTKYNSALAKAAYLSGDKEQAVIYANRFIDLNNTVLNAEQKKLIPNHSQEVYDMFKIKYNHYKDK